MKICWRADLSALFMAMEQQCCFYFECIYLSGLMVECEKRATLRGSTSSESEPCPSRPSFPLPHLTCVFVCVCVCVCV